MEIVQKKVSLWEKTGGFERLNSRRTLSVPVSVVTGTMGTQYPFRPFSPMPEGLEGGGYIAVRYNMHDTSPVVQNRRQGAVMCRDVLW